jgi:transcriptional regulator with XRE-family HTH domain
MGTSTWDSQHEILREVLRTARKDGSLTQLQLADLLGHPQSYVSKYESGERRLDLPEIRAIAHCVGLNLSTIIDRFENKIFDRS